MTFIPSPINPTTTEAKPSPFIAFTQRVIPATFDQSLSYQEALYALLNFLQKEVVPTINANAEVTEQQTKVIEDLVKYVNEYFDNLDVQEEINNKLDVMAEDGTLAEIVTAYLNVKSILAYNTIAEMSEATNIIEGSFLAVYGLNTLNDHVLTFYKARQIRNTDVVDGINLVALADEDLVAEIMTNPLISSFATVADMVDANLLVGQTVKTLGYYAIGDGGGAEYIISSTEGEVGIELDNGNYANLIINEINLMQLGCHGDGTTDDNTAFHNAITLAKTHHKKLTSPSGKSYLISSTLDLSNLYVDLNFSEIKTNNYISIITLNTPDRFGEIKNITLNCANASIGIEIVTARTTEIDHINFINVEGIGIKKLAGYEIKVHHCNFMGATNASTSIGVETYTPDDYYCDIIMTDINTCFHVDCISCNVTNTHSWIGNSSALYNSAFIKLESHENARIFISNSYCDTMKYFVYCNNTLDQNMNPWINFINCDMETNLQFYTDAIGDQYWVYFVGGNDQNTRGIMIENSCYIGVTGRESLTVTSYMSNVLFNPTPSMELAYVDYNPLYTENISNDKFSGTIKYKKNRDGIVTMYGELTAINNNTAYPAFTLPYTFRPNGRYIGVVEVSDDRWSPTATNGYIYIDETAGNVTINTSNNTATPKYVKFGITYIARI